MEECTRWMRALDILLLVVFRDDKGLGLPLIFCEIIQGSSK